MTDFLIRTLIKNPDDIQKPEVRLAYSTLASGTGMICNILLFVLKFLVGTACGSIAVVSDGFNNLSDCLSNILSLFGYRLAAKPADQEHPFGHGRMEYIVSFIISIIILIFSWELFVSSAKHIWNASTVAFDPVMIVLLLLSCIVKVWMSILYRKIGDRISNPGLAAASADSRNDVLTTAATVAAMLLSCRFPNIPFDGIAGVVLSVFIALSGLGIAQDIISRILGGPADAALTQSLTSIVLQEPEIIGVHDIIIHDYGAGRRIGSAHAEVPSDMTLLEAHEIIDRIERHIEADLNIQMTIHMDPVTLNDPESRTYRDQMQKVLHRIDPLLSLHDFQLTHHSGRKTLSFDVLIPYSCKVSAPEIRRNLEEVLPDPDSVALEINFDHAFTEARK